MNKAIETYIKGLNRPTEFYTFQLEFYSRKCQRKIGATWMDLIGQWILSKSVISMLERRLQEGTHPSKSYVASMRKRVQHPKSTC